MDQSPVLYAESDAAHGISVAAVLPAEKQIILLADRSHGSSALVNTVTAVDRGDNSHAGRYPGMALLTLETWGGAGKLLASSR